MDLVLFVCAVVFFFVVIALGDDSYQGPSL